MANFKIIKTPSELGSVQFFGHLHVGEYFTTVRGLEYIKTTSRTARAIDGGHVVTFSSNAYCKVTRHADSYDN